MAHPEVEKIPLELEDALGYPVEGLLPLLDALDQPGCRPHLFLQVLPGARLVLALLPGETAVQRAHAQTGNPLVVQKNHIFPGDLLHRYVWNDRTDLLFFEAARRARLQRGDQVSGVDDILYRDAEIPRQPVIALVLQLVQMGRDDARRQAVAEAEIFQLNQEAFPETARGNPDRIEKLNLLQPPFRLFGRGLRRLADLFQGNAEVAVLVEVADHIGADSLLALGEPRHAQLPD